MDEAIKALPAEFSEVIRLYLDGLPSSENAKSLGITPSYFRVKVMRAKQMMTDYVTERLSEEG